MTARDKTRSLVEAAMLAALTVILLLPTIYLPVLGMITLFVWPVPITVLGVRHGHRLSFLAMLTAGLIAGLLTQPLTAVTMTIWLGFLGITLGYCFRRGMPAFQALAWGTGTVLAGTLVLFLISLLVFGVNPFVASQTLFAESGAHVLEFYQQLGLPEEQLAQMEEIYTGVAETMRYLLPATLLLGSIFSTFINFSVARLVMGRLGQPVPGFPPFSRWQFPTNLLWAFLVGIAALYAGNYYDIGLLVEIGLNIQVIFTLLFSVAGLAVIHHLLERYRVGGFLKGFVTVIIVLNPFLFQVTAFVGIFDLVFNLRKL